MSNLSPGQGHSPWSASLPNDELPLEYFFRSGVGSIPVALVPSSGGFIRLNNPKAIQVELQAMTPHFQLISDVRQFGRGGLVCRSSDPSCVSDILKCKTFASVPVSAFIPPHLACTKGIVRGVDSTLTPAETLEKLSDAGVIAVYRCNRLVNGEKVPTESVIATFAGTSCPSELKIWPLIFRVERLASRPLQCQNCWRFGHSAGGCKSNSRCRICGDTHPSKECIAETEKCCLCAGNHAADYLNCTARSNETQLLEIMDRRRCSRREAITVVKDRAFGYAGVASRHEQLSETKILNLIEAAVEKAMSKALEHIVTSVSECISQVFCSQMTQLASAVAVPMAKSAPCAVEVIPNLAPQRQSREEKTPISSVPSTSTHVEDQNEMDVCQDFRRQKRTGSPLKSPCPNTKPKKGSENASALIKESILEAAVAEVFRSST